MAAAAAIMDAPLRQACTRILGGRAGPALNQSIACSRMPPFPWLARPSPFATARFLDEPSWQRHYNLGAGYDLTKNLLLSMYSEEYRALTEGLSNPRDILFALNYQANDSLMLNTSILGLSDCAPDYGLTGGIGWRF